MASSIIDKTRNAVEVFAGLARIGAGMVKARARTAIGIPTLLDCDACGGTDYTMRVRDGHRVCISCVEVEREDAESARARDASHLDDADAKLSAMRKALTMAGVPESEPYPDDAVSDWERSLRTGGYMIGGVTRIQRLATERDAARTVLAKATEKLRALVNEETSAPEVDVTALRAKLAAAEKRAEEAEATIAEFRKEHAMWAEVNRVQLDKRDKLIGELRCDLHLLETERGDEVARGLEAEGTHKATRARLAAAEAVIAALPKCEQFINGDVGYCPRVATREDRVGGSGEYFTRYWCDEHQPYGADEDTWAAAPLRAYLALVGSQR